MIGITILTQRGTFALGLYSTSSAISPKWKKKQYQNIGSGIKIYTNITTEMIGITILTQRGTFASGSYSSSSAISPKWKKKTKHYQTIGSDIKINTNITKEMIGTTILTQRGTFASGSYFSSSAISPKWKKR